MLHGRCTQEERLRLLQEPNMNTTGRLMSWCPLHIGMRVRCTLAVEPPYVVPDSEGVVCGIEFHSLEPRASLNSSAQVVVLRYMPVQIYVKIQDLQHELLPPQPCNEHSTAPSRECHQCCFFPGIVCIRPQTSRAWRYDLDAATRQPQERVLTISVKRTQIPLAPANAGTLYTLQGTTAEPGLIFHWSMPRRLESTLRWLVVYVALSRVRSLSSLRSIGLTTAVRRIIEEGPPDKLHTALKRLFGDKIADTDRSAAAAREKLGWPTTPA